jgi:2-polyprenyl-6-hydroxyphenyl methylase / 3-demethylubiquinone-9 3-methyltransferase
MRNASAGKIGATINPKEADHFNSLAKDWWDPKGASAMLHKLNPVRLRFVREAIDAHWGGDPRALKPLMGKTSIDVGCGAGLMVEPLARLGARATGVDAASENIAVAKAHAAEQSLDIDYICADVATLSGQFDLVTSMEVVEHVADPALFIQALADRLAPGGLMILSTPNRTPLSRVAMITLGEGTGQIPKGTHNWDQFLNPDELTSLTESAGLRVVQTRGIVFRPSTGFVLSDDLSLNYLMAITRAAQSG